ncbi:MAG: hypothetical protein KJP14_05730 [Eudoraea sp.]|nr:hypothetical protein [Eudoraea sp.]
MIHYRIFGVFFAAFFFWSCSSDDGANSVAEQDTLPDFQVIGEDGSSIYQYSYSSTDEEGSILDLTQVNGVNRQYITLRQTGDLISFFSFASDSFSVVLHDAFTNTAISYPNFYSVSDDRAITWGSNSEFNLFLGFYTPRGTRNYNVRIIDPETGLFTDVPVAFNTTRAFQPLYSNGRLVLPYQDSIENYQIAILDTDNASITRTLNFGGAVTNLFLNDSDDLVVLSSLDQSNYQYTIYDLQTLAVNEEGNFVLNKFLPSGRLEANLSDNKLYYINFFAQPYPLTSGPAVYDLTLQEDRVIDMLGIAQEIEAEIGTSLVLTDIYYLESAELFAVCYAEATPADSWNGGLIFLRPSGEIVYRLELPFVPTYLVRQ